MKTKLVVKNGEILTGDDLMIFAQLVRSARPVKFIMGTDRITIEQMPAEPQEPTAPDSIPGSSVVSSDLS